LFVSHRQEALEELVERIPGFEVVVQRFYRHSCADKDCVPPRMSGSLCTTVVLVGMPGVFLSSIVSPCSSFSIRRSELRHRRAAACQPRTEPCSARLESLPPPH
jgi:hypothetical protein